MIQVNKKSLQPGMTLGRDVYAANGKVLLSSGIVLTQSIIDCCKESDSASFIVDFDGMDDNGSIMKITLSPNKEETILQIGASIDLLGSIRHIDLQDMRATINEVVNAILSSREVLLHLAEIRAYDYHTFSHSVNVCILSVVMAINMGYNRTQLEELAIGSLLHDIGKIRVGKDIIDKPSELGPEEYSAVREHPQKGFEILQSFPGIPKSSTQISLQHHERWDGHGYPQQLAGDQIHEYARITAVADVYDALMADRPYQPGYPIDYSISIIKGMSGTFLDPRSVEALFASITIYPVVIKRGNLATG